MQDIWHCAHSHLRRKIAYHDPSDIWMIVDSWILTGYCLKNPAMLGARSDARSVWLHCYVNELSTKSTCFENLATVKLILLFMFSLLFCFEQIHCAHNKIQNITVSFFCKGHWTRANMLTGVVWIHTSMGLVLEIFHKDWLLVAPHSCWPTLCRN